MSPTSSPSSSAGSPPDSSPADTTFSASDVASTSTSRPSFVPLSFPPLSRLPPSASSEQPYQPFRTRNQSPSLSPPIQHSILASETSAAATRRHEEFEYGANSVKTEESENIPGTSSSHQRHSPQIGKKKRTRTLTTPQQSAVLHALLAQSRFPTTAMREEVGRAIGLSARKVQVWFQNQRQKARKPRSQGRSASVEPSLPSGSGSGPPPQFGPFNPVPISQSFSAENIPIPAAGSSSSTDLSRKSSLYDEDLASSGSPSIMRGLPMSIPTPGSGGGTSSSMESEFHMGVGTTSPNYSPVLTTTAYNETRQFHHPDHRAGVGSIGMPLKIELSPVSLRSSILDSRYGHKGSATPPHPPFLHYSPSAGSRAINPNRSPSSVYPFTVGTGAIREEDKPTRPSDSFFPEAPIILPPIRLSNDPTSSSPHNRGGSESSNSLARPDPHLRYSASFPSYSQDPGNLRSTPPSLSRSSASGLPPPFTLQPRPQWDWDRPLGTVLPTIGLPPNATNTGIVYSTGLRQPHQSPNFMHPRPRTTSDPAPSPPDTRQSALLTEPWPLPPSQLIDPSAAQRRALIEREEQQRLQYDVTKTTASGEIRSTETQPSANSPSNRPRANEGPQREHRSSAFTLQPTRDYQVE